MIARSYNKNPGSFCRLKLSKRVLVSRCSAMDEKVKQDSAGNASKPAVNAEAALKDISKMASKVANTYAPRASKAKGMRNTVVLG